jgi:hypothetical protein
MTTYVQCSKWCDEMYKRLAVLEHEASHAEGFLLRCAKELLITAGRKPYKTELLKFPPAEQLVTNRAAWCALTFQALRDAHVQGLDPGHPLRALLQLTGSVWALSGDDGRYLSAVVNRPLGPN